jgi:hypothetical protein
MLSAESRHRLVNHHRVQTQRSSRYVDHASYLSQSGWNGDLLANALPIRIEFDRIIYVCTLAAIGFMPCVYGARGPLEGSIKVSVKPFPRRQDIGGTVGQIKHDETLEQ